MLITCVYKYPPSLPRVFHRRLTGGGFLTIGYCFPYFFLEPFVGDKVVMGGSPVPTRENPITIDKFGANRGENTSAQTQAEKGDGLDAAS